MKILLVDDEKSVRDLIDRLLTGLGHNVLTSENGAAAWEVFPQEKFDLIISDIKMPQMDGLELLRRVKTVKPDLPPARGFQEEIVELVRELLKNSLKAVQDLEDPLIEIATSKHSQHDVLLVVEDNGPGISVEDRDNLFIPFFTTDPKIGRPGLGLSKVYATARR